MDSSDDLNIFSHDPVDKLYFDYCELSPNEKTEFLGLVNGHYISNEKITISKQKNSIKVWPYLDDVSQAIIPYSTEHLSEDINTVVNLDFSRVKRVNSSGSAITLMKLISTLSKKMYLYRMIHPEDPEVEKYFQKSGFFAILDEYFHLTSKIDLFDDVNINRSVEPCISFDKNKSIKKTSFSIYQLKHSNEKNRENIEVFIDYLTDIFIEYLSRSNIKYNVLISIINEIAKNAHDHAASNTCFGLDIIEEADSNNGELFFSFSDLGVGIATNIKNNLTTSSKLMRAGAKEKFSFSDAYQFAFTPGNTTSRESRNKGIGMSMIMDGTKSLNLDLTIWDGRSMLFLPDKNSHAEIRRNIFDTGNSVGFYYYGRLKF